MNHDKALPFYKQQQIAQLSNGFVNIPQPQSNYGSPMITNLPVVPNEQFRSRTPTSGNRIFSEDDTGSPLSRLSETRGIKDAIKKNLKLRIEKKHKLHIHSNNLRGIASAPLQSPGLRSTNTASPDMLHFLMLQTAEYASPALQYRTITPLHSEFSSPARPFPVDMHSPFAAPIDQMVSTQFTNNFIPDNSLTPILVSKPINQMASNQATPVYNYPTGNDSALQDSMSNLGIGTPIAFQNEQIPTDTATSKTTASSHITKVDQWRNQLPSTFGGSMDSMGGTEIMAVQPNVGLFQASTSSVFLSSASLNTRASSVVSQSDTRVKQEDEMFLQYLNEN